MGYVWGSDIERSYHSPRNRCMSVISYLFNSFYVGSASRNKELNHLISIFLKRYTLLPCPLCINTEFYFYHARFVHFPESYRMYILISGTILDCEKVYMHQIWWSLANVSSSVSLTLAATIDPMAFGWRTLCWSEIAESSVLSLQPTILQILLKGILEKSHTKH